MTFQLGVSVFVILVLLVISGLFTASETALAAVSKTRLQRLAAEGSSRARQSVKLIGDRERVDGALLVGKTFLNVLATALTTWVVLQLLGDRVLAASLVATVLILVFVETLPRTLAAADSERFVLSASGLIRAAVPMLAPIPSALQRMIQSVFGLSGGSVAAAPVPAALEDIRGSIEQRHQEAGAEREHRDMLEGVLDLAHLKVGDVMVHRKNMEVLDVGAAPETIVERVLLSQHTRFPIWRDDPENIVGVLHLKVLLRTLMERKGSIKNLDVLSLAAEPWYVPDTTTLEEQLGAFRDRREHFAFVVDEYGVLQGLVTLEDILEEVFGKIAEGRQAAERIRLQADGSYIIEGQMPVRELNRQLHWTLPVNGATTIAGLVIDEARIIPDAGQVFSFYGFKFEVLRRQRNQLAALRITPPQPAPEELADDTG
jgi:Mg2+/Co2+ transporter CorB